LGFWYEDQTGKYDLKAHEKHPIHEKTTWKLKNKDEIDESHKSQLKFEYDVHLFNYTIKNFKTKKPKWDFWVFLGFYPIPQPWYLVDDEAGEAEIGEFSLSVIVEQYVLTLEVSVSDVVAVKILNAEHDAVEDGTSLILREWATTEDVFQQVSSLRLLHDNARVRTDTHNLLDKISHNITYG